MPISPRVFAIALLLSCPITVARAEVFVRWDLDEVPSRDSLGISTLLVQATKPGAVQEAIGRGYRVFVEFDAAALSAMPTLPDGVTGVVVRGGAVPQQLDALRKRLREPGARVLTVDDRGSWPHVRLNWVTMRNDVLQVSSRTAQPWVESNAVLARVASAAPVHAPLLLAPAWEPLTVADAHRGPALENYLVAIAEAGSFGHDLVLPLHERFQRALIMGQPTARAEWREIRQYLEFYSWDLARRYRRVSNIGVVVGDPMGSIEILRLLTRHNLPFEVVLPDRVRPDVLKAFTLVIALDPPDTGGRAALDAFARGGGTVVLNGPATGTASAPASQGAVLVENAHHVARQVGAGRVLALRDAVADPDEFARDMREVLGEQGRVVDVWNGITVLVAPYEEPGGDNVLVTAMNYAHDARPIQVRVKGTFSVAYYESPESPAALLPLQHRDGYTEFVLPVLRVGGRVFLGREHTAENDRARNGER